MTEELPGVGTGAPAPTPAQQLRAGFKAAKEQTTRDIKMAGYDELHIIFRRLDDYTEVRAMVAEASRASRHLPREEQEKYIALETLLLSSVDSYAVVEGDRVPIGHPLGVELYNWVNPPEDPEEGKEGEYRPATDREAAPLLFLSETIMMALWTELEMWFRSANAQIADELLGNF